MWIQSQYEWDGSNKGCCANICTCAFQVLIPCLAVGSIRTYERTVHINVPQAACGESWLNFIHSVSHIWTFLLSKILGLNITDELLSVGNYIHAYRMEPLNNTGSWRIMDSLDRSVWRGSLEMSTPSIMIFPVPNSREQNSCDAQW